MNEILEELKFLVGVKEFLVLRFGDNELRFRSFKVLRNLNFKFKLIEGRKEILNFRFWVWKFVNVKLRSKCKESLEKEC